MLPSFSFVSLLPYWHDNTYKQDSQKQLETTRMKDQMLRGVKVPCKKHCSTTNIVLLLPQLLLLLLLLLAPTKCVIAFAPAPFMSTRLTTTAGRAQVVANNKTTIALHAYSKETQNTAGERILVESDRSYNNASSSCQHQPYNNNHNRNLLLRSPTQSCLLGLASLSLATTPPIAHPLETQASFGPSSGATTLSPPGLSCFAIPHHDTTCRPSIGDTGWLWTLVGGHIA